MQASRAWGDELEGQAEAARALGEVPVDLDPAQLAFELNALADAANAVYKLHGDRRAFERARAAVARLLG